MRPLSVDIGSYFAVKSKHSYIASNHNSIQVPQFNPWPTIAFKCRKTTNNRKTTSVSSSSVISARGSKKNEFVPQEKFESMHGEIVTSQKMINSHQLDRTRLAWRQSHSLLVLYFFIILTITMIASFSKCQSKHHVHREAEKQSTILVPQSVYPAATQSHRSGSLPGEWRGKINCYERFA